MVRVNFCAVKVFSLFFAVVTLVGCGGGGGDGDSGGGATTNATYGTGASGGNGVLIVISEA